MQQNHRNPAPLNRAASPAPHPGAVSHPGARPPPYLIGLRLPRTGGTAAVRALCRSV